MGWFIYIYLSYLFRRVFCIIPAFLHIFPVPPPHNSYTHPTCKLHFPSPVLHLPHISHTYLTFTFTIYALSSTPHFPALLMYHLVQSCISLHSSHILLVFKFSFQQVLCMLYTHVDLSIMSLHTNLPISAW